jgi:hypothetical protein
MRGSRRAIATVYATLLFAVVALTIFAATMLAYNSYNYALSWRLMSQEDRVNEDLFIVWINNTASPSGGVAPWRITIRNEAFYPLTTKVVAVYRNHVFRASLNSTLVSSGDEVASPPIPDTSGVTIGDVISITTERGNTFTVVATINNLINPPWPGPGGVYVYPYTLVVSIVDTPGHSPGTNDRFWLYIAEGVYTDPNPLGLPDYQKSPESMDPNWYWGVEEGWYTVWAYQIRGQGGDTWYGPTSIKIGPETPSPQITWAYAIASFSIGMTSIPSNVAENGNCTIIATVSDALGPLEGVRLNFATAAGNGDFNGTASPQDDWGISNSSGKVAISFRVKQFAQGLVNVTATDPYTLTRGYVLIHSLCDIRLDRLTYYLSSPGSTMITAQLTDGAGNELHYNNVPITLEIWNWTGPKPKSPTLDGETRITLTTDPDGKVTATLAVGDVGGKEGSKYYANITASAEGYIPATSGIEVTN